MNYIAWFIELLSIFVSLYIKIWALVQVQANFPFPSLIDIEHLGRRKEVQVKLLESMCTGNRIIFSGVWALVYLCIHFLRVFRCNTPITRQYFRVTCWNFSEWSKGFSDNWGHLGMKPWHVPCISCRSKENVR